MTEYNNVSHAILIKKLNRFYFMAIEDLRLAGEFGADSKEHKICDLLVQAGAFAKAYMENNENEAQVRRQVIIELLDHLED